MSWTSSEVTYRNKEHHEDVKAAKNTDASAGGDSSHLSLILCVVRKRI
jgi:hypothetical protein